MGWKCFDEKRIDFQSRPLDDIAIPSRKKEQLLFGVSFSYQRFVDWLFVLFFLLTFYHYKDIDPVLSIAISFYSEMLRNRKESDIRI